jgi:hypothetical protein
MKRKREQTQEKKAEGKRTFKSRRLKSIITTIEKNVEAIS